MLKRNCIICGKEMTSSHTLKGGVSNEPTVYEIHLRRHRLFKEADYLNLSKLNLEVQFIPTLKGLGILEHVI